MHREVLGSPPNATAIADHINGNSLDNRRHNLRWASRKDNQKNRLKKAPASSRYKGVHWNTKKQKWIASLRLDNKRNYLGAFDTELEAAQAYDAAAKSLFGEFARPNLGE